MVRACPRAALLLCTVAILAACGHTLAAGASRTMEVALTEYRLNPQDVRARAGVLAFLVHNYGRMTHNFVITQGTATWGTTPPIGPGHSAWLTVTLPAGQYTMASNMLADQALGEYGTLTITRS